jgi:hypothetical protein
MTDNKQKKIIVVLGAGRTGTSLLMQILQRLSMVVSEKMTPPSEQNIDGGFEDTDVFSIQSEMLAVLGTNQLIPLPDGWQDNDELNAPRKQLERIITQRIENAKTIFGIKDPRTSLFLPIWKRIFNSNKIVPVYLLAIRKPESTIRSLKTQYSFRESVSELFWLHKNCDALAQTGANCYIVHYEDWFTRGEELASELLKVTGLDAYFNESSIADVLKEVVKENYNRSIYTEYEIQNEYVSSLYSALQQCRGKDFDRAPLMQAVQECQRGMNSFKGWYQLAFDAGQADVQGQGALTRRNKSLEVDLKKVVTHNNKQLKEIKGLRDDVEVLRSQVDQSRQRLRMLQDSLFFRLRDLLSDAIRRPGVNTILMPFRVIKLVSGYLLNR